MSEFMPKKYTFHFQKKQKFNFASRKGNEKGRFENKYIWLNSLEFVNGNNRAGIPVTKILQVKRIISTTLTC